MLNHKIMRFPRLKDDVGIPVCNIKAKSVKWLWPHRIPLGKLTILDGDPDVGKSLVSVDLAACVSAGRALPDGAESLPGNVIIISAEDDAADTIRPRLEAAGANLTRVTVIDMIRDRDGGERSFEIPGDLDRLEKEIRDRQAVLVIIDPLMAFLPLKVNSWRDQDVRRALAPLAKLAERTGAAILIIRHLNKKENTRAIYRGGGSIGIIGAARSGLLIAPDPEDPEIRVLASMKANLSRRRPSLAFRIVETTIEGLEGTIPKVKWLGNVEASAESLLNSEGNPRTSAVEFLQRTLRSGPMSAEKVKELARESGIAPRTLDRAKVQLNIEACKKGFGDEGYWVWSLEKGRK